MRALGAAWRFVCSTYFALVIGGWAGGVAFVALAYGEVAVAALHLLIAVLAFILAAVSQRRGDREEAAADARAEQLAALRFQTARQSGIAEGRDRERGIR